MNVQSSNAFFGRALREAHTTFHYGMGNRPRMIRLPEPNQIGFDRNGPEIHIHMKAKAVCANMQTNGAAFEGWSLALRLWLRPIANTISLHWEPSPLDPSTGDRDPHYARFLYRVQRFADLFPDWFRIGSSEHLDACEVRNGTPLYLNVAGSSSRKPLDPKRETDMERKLVTEYADAFRNQFGLRAVDRQFPVGLYRSADLKGRVFTAGTSAIDIIGTGDHTISMFELKAGDNIDIGGLGEMLFYASVLRDAVGPTARFQFGQARSALSRSCIGPIDVESAKAVRAFYLAENLHPLLEHPLLIATLNEASARQRHAVPLTFDAFKISGFDDGEPRFRRF